MDDSTFGLIAFIFGIIIGVVLVTNCFNPIQNKELCLKLYSNSAKLYSTCNSNSLYSNVTKIKGGN